MTSFLNAIGAFFAPPPEAAAVQRQSKYNPEGAKLGWQIIEDRVTLCFPSLITKGPTVTKYENHSGAATQFPCYALYYCNLKPLTLQEHPYKNMATDLAKLRKQLEKTKKDYNLQLKLDIENKDLSAAKENYDQLKKLFLNGDEDNIDPEKKIPINLFFKSILEIISLQKITDVIESDLSSELSKNDLNIFGELWKDHNVLAKAQQEGTAKFKDLESFKNKLINKWSDFYNNAKTALDAKHKSNPIEVTQKMVDDFEALNQLILGNEFLKPN